MTAPRRVDGDTTFALGMNSLFDPSQLTAGLYAVGMNVLNRGGVVQCRPGYECLFAMPSGNLQACILFRPKEAPQQIVFVVDGRVYVSDIPFTTYRLLTNVLMSEVADRIHWVQAEKAVERNEDGSLTLITPKSVLILQDGVSPPAYFDGAESGHLRNTNPLANTLTPQGGPMAWVGNRLWVARGSKVFASDIDDPFSFTEDTYLGGNPFFTVPGNITAMAVTPTIEYQQLLVFTADSTSMFQASNRDRASWPSTVNFQTVLLPNVGCTASKSVRAHYGLLYWYGNFGLTALNVASATYTNSRLPYIDNEMSASKGRMQGDLSGIVTSTYENYLLVSVPHGDKYNRHTWVMDNSVGDTVQGSAPVAWNTFWTGTRPVEWCGGEVLGIERSFYASKDYDGVNRLWEAFLPQRRDHDCPITWYVETRGYFSQLPLQDKEFRYADVFLSELEDTVDVGVFWAGANRGPYKKILTKRIQAMRGSIRYDTVLQNGVDCVYALKKQSRRVRTQDARLLPSAEDSSCGVEYEKIENIDDAFQLLIVGSGAGAVRGVRMFFDAVNDDLSGTCERDETEQRAVRFDGAASKGDVDEVLADLNTPPEKFESTQTIVASVKGFTAVESGSGLSVITQADADKIAECIAWARAAHELSDVVPPVLGGKECLTT